MDTTFISIHDLSPEARILYSSDSIVDILGYSPEDVLGRSCWEFFHPDELPLAQSKHEKSIEMDKAAVLAYCRMQDSAGDWVGCEIIFTVVYDVLVGCTTVYKPGPKSDTRAFNAPVVRRLFSSAPQDPRYHMLSHLSTKLSSSMLCDPHEPRAALFLNRYTRTLTIMHATNGLAEVLGIRGEDMRGQSFYFCIREDCLQESVRCLENAKGNDSIAYLRFWYRDPRQDEEPTQPGSNSRALQMESKLDTEDEEMPDVSGGGSSSSSSGINPLGVAGLTARMPESLEGRRAMNRASVESDPFSSTSSAEAGVGASPRAHLQPGPSDSRTTSGESNPMSYEAVFGDLEPGLESSASSTNATPLHTRRNFQPSIELEAVISCTSDGLVVCMRCARPVSPEANQLNPPAAKASGFATAPWAVNPTFSQAHPIPEAPSAEVSGVVPRTEPPQAVAGRDESDYMRAIREIGVFAWGVTGINGSLAEYGRGRPSGQAQPAEGLPIWQPDAQQSEAPPSTPS